MVILGDSIPKYITGIEGVHLKAFRGDTIGRLANRLLNKQISLDNFNYVLIHVGTNDIANKCSLQLQHAFNCIISDYGNLIGICRKLKPSINILVSAILPRPVDHEKSDPLIRKLNAYLQKNMSKTMKFTFLRTYKPFMYAGKVKRELFAKNDGGLHLNTEGTNKLRHFFLRTIASI